MKKLFIFMLVLIPIVLWAHSPLLVVEDNGDGTIYIEAGFSNGATAEGAKIIIKLKKDDSVVWEGTMTADYLEVEMPNEPYTVTMDAGPGHAVTKDGPEPEGGFGAATTKEETSTDTSSSNEPSTTQVATTDAGVAWNPAMTTAAIPAKPPTALEIIKTIIAIIQVLILAYIAILIKRNKN